MSALRAIWARVASGLASLWSRIRDEPVLLTTFVGALIDVFVVFGTSITPEQKTALIVAVTAALALFARSKVSPV